MLSGLIKLLPLLQLLLEIFKPGDGEKVTRGAKITALALTAILLYSGFVSYAYVEQYHAYVTATTQNTYLDSSLSEKKGEIASLKVELSDYREKYFKCLEDGSYNQPDNPIKVVETPPPPVHATTTPRTPKVVARHPIGMPAGTEFRQELLEELNKE